MKRLAFGFVVAVICSPFPAVACVFPTPRTLAWASCAIAAMPRRDAAALAKLEDQMQSSPLQFEQVTRRKIRKWTPTLKRVCGSYAMLRRAEEHRMKMPGPRLTQYVPESRAEVISILLLMRRQNITVGCGG
ncbi:hypothetical protein NDN01_24300 [Sphingomonas sp. QA11]|uniref:hypothetical protein n=1 Tax=Sphingomonas sp. QA11 TaxID=2950605 RepID=UPI002349D86D|nr:hypothetical protein [Sphingomonas sp. QA11]WCM27066.1 hypothetical protein NDN01_24300 [Sphingomonas sp. QA11]